MAKLPTEVDRASEVRLGVGGPAEPPAQQRRRRRTAMPRPGAAAASRRARSSAASVAPAVGQPLDLLDRRPHGLRRRCPRCRGRCRGRQHGVGAAADDAGRRPGRCGDRQRPARRGRYGRAGSDVGAHPGRRAVQRRPRRSPSGVNAAGLRMAEQQPPVRRQALAEATHQRLHPLGMEVDQHVAAQHEVETGRQAAAPRPRPEASRFCRSNRTMSRKAGRSRQRRPSLSSTGTKSRRRSASDSERSVQSSELGAAGRLQRRGVQVGAEDGDRPVGEPVAQQPVQQDRHRVGLRARRAARTPDPQAAGSRRGRAAAPAGSPRSSAANCSAKRKKNVSPMVMSDSSAVHSASATGSPARWSSAR